MIGNGAPFYYDHANAVNSELNPSSMHVSNVGLNRYFVRYLLQKAFSVYKWTMPVTWAKDYFLYTLYSWGFISVINNAKFGVIPQGCSLRGYDVFYRPTEVVIANPLITGLKSYRIGVDAEIIKLQSDYGGVMDIIQFYADMLTLCAETAGTNIMNSKLSYVFATENKSLAESFKKMFDKIMSGEPAVAVGKGLFKEDGTPAWETFAQDLKSNYIAGDILSDMRKWEDEFDTVIGIKNANTDKKERLITDEVNANNEEIRTLSGKWLENLQEGCKKVRKHFDVELSVDWRNKDSEVSANG